MRVILPDGTDSNFPTARAGSTPRARSGRSSPSRPCSCAQRQRPRPPAAARRRRADPDPDDARPRGPRRPLRPAPLGRAPARRGGAAPLPGDEGGDRAADRERLLLRLRVPGAGHRGGARAARGGDPREIAEGRTWERRESSRDEARAYFEEQGEPYKVELVDTAEGDISIYEQGDFVDLCRGPHLQNAEPIKAVKLLSSPAPTGAATRTAPAHARLRDRLLRPAGPGGLPAPGRGGEAPRPPAARGRSCTSSTSPSWRPGCRSGTRAAW